MGKRVISDMERNNKTTMACHAFEAVIYIGTFIGELVAGNRSILYVLVIALLAAGPVAAEFFFWSKDHETIMIKHLVAIGFAVLYTFVLFTTTNSLMYVYVIPMVFVVSVYNDARYTLIICIGTMIESLISVFGGAATGGFGFHDMGSGLIQITVMVLVVLYSYMTARTLEANNRQKLKTVEDANVATENLLDNMEETSKAMQIGIDDINEKVDKLSAASRATKEAMENVTSGANETAEAVQRQMTQTEEIQQKAAQVGEASEAIRESMNQTLAVLENGKRDIEVLVNEVDDSVRKGADVAEKLEKLDRYIEEMNSIVELIQGITSQTSLLALNASIEAARAGEAGRGFAVVATEISGMAIQTKEATVHITELIENVSGAISGVVFVIREMIEGINGEKQSTENTAASFVQIEENTDVIRENIERLAMDVEELERANREITSSVQTISAVSEEVSAHANETLSAEEENMENLDAITEKMHELVKLTQK